MYIPPGKDEVLWFIVRHWEGEWEEGDALLLGPVFGCKVQNYMGGHLGFAI